MRRNSLAFSGRLPGKKSQKSMSQEIPSRREWLRRVTVTSAVIGGVSGTAAGIVAGGDTADDGDETTSEADTADAICARAPPIRLTPACGDTDENADGPVFCITNDSEHAVSLEWRAVSPPDERIEFIDCRRIRVFGEFADVIVTATFVGAGDEVGNVIEPVGAVDGERIIDVRELEQFPDDAIIGSVEAFREEPVVPGVGAFTASNPQFSACQEVVFGEVAVGDESDERVAESESDEESGPDPATLETVTVPAGATTCFTADVDAADGPVAVQLFREGAMIADRSSATANSCPLPVRVGRADPVTVPTRLITSTLCSCGRSRERRGE